MHSSNHEDLAPLSRFFGADSLGVQALSFLALALAAFLFAYGSFPVSQGLAKPFSTELGVYDVSPRGALGGRSIPASCPSNLHDAASNYGARCGTNGYIQCDGSCSEVCTPLEWNASTCNRCNSSGTGWEPQCTDFGDGSSKAAWCSCSSQCTGASYNACMGVPPDVCSNIAGTQTSVPSGYTADGSGNCTPSSCSYNGTVQWSSCSGSYNGTVQNGGTATVQNTAAGYTGSAVFSCTNGEWVGDVGASSCIPVPTWSAWSACSGACGGGTGTQTRSCSTGNSANCSGPSSQVCVNNAICPGVPTWSAWSACSGACGGGTGTQTRSCSTGNSANCSGPSSQVCVNNATCPNSNPGGGTDTTTQTSSSSCTPTTLCSGSNVVSRSATCVDTQVESCDYGCSGGQCDPPPQISFLSFSGANSVSGSFTATGHLQARPLLVRQGDSTWLYWSVSNASSCSVTGSNGDAWSANSSGPAGRISRPITGKTTYTLHCTALPGATPPSITETAIVNIVPAFQEK